MRNVNGLSDASFDSHPQSSTTATKNSGHSHRSINEILFIREFPLATLSHHPKFIPEIDLHHSYKWDCPSISRKCWCSKINHPATVTLKTGPETLHVSVLSSFTKRIVCHRRVGTIIVARATTLRATTRLGFFESELVLPAELTTKTKTRCCPSILTMSEKSWRTIP